MGITSDMIPELSQHSLNDLCTLTNPRIPDLKDYERLFLEAIG